MLETPYRISSDAIFVCRQDKKFTELGKTRNTVVQWGSVVQQHFNTKLRHSGLKPFFIYDSRKFQYEFGMRKNEKRFFTEVFNFVLPIVGYFGFLKQMKELKLKTNKNKTRKFDKEFGTHKPTPSIAFLVQLEQQ